MTVEPQILGGAIIAISTLLIAWMRYRLASRCFDVAERTGARFKCGVIEFIPRNMEDNKEKAVMERSGTLSRDDNLEGTSRKSEKQNDTR